MIIILKLFKIISINTIMSEEMQVNQTVTKNSGISKKAGLTMPCSYQLKRLHKWVGDFNKKNFSRYNEKKGRNDVRGVSCNKYSSIFTSGVLEHVARVLAEESLRHWAGDVNSSNRINCQDVHSMITSPNNMDLNVLFPFPTLERARDLTNLERKLHDLNRKRKAGKDIDNDEYQNVVNQLTEKSPLNLITDDKGTTFKWYYDAKKVKPIMKEIYQNTEVHTHKQSEEEQVEVENDGDENEQEAKSSMTINDNTRVYINVLMEDLVMRFLERLCRHVTQTCSSDESLNDYSKSRKKADLKHIRFTFETLLYGNLLKDAFQYGQQAVDRYKDFEVANKEAKAAAAAEEEAKAKAEEKAKAETKKTKEKKKDKDGKKKEKSDKPKIAKK